MLLTFLVLASTAVAQPMPPRDGQVLVVPYLPDQAVPLSITTGYATVIELAPDERIENVVVGDSGAWQVTPTKQGDRLVIKPLSGSASTDLIVMTASRRYLFLLRASDGSESGPFVVRFNYPDATPAGEPAGAIVMTRYKLRGDTALFPATMSNDGSRTFITWKAGTALPAVFAIDGQGHEALVNGRMVGPTYVIEGAAARYVLKRDRAEATAVRQKPRMPR